MTARIACLTGYLVLTVVFATATFMSHTETQSVAMTSISVEKTNRLNIGSPDTFVADRFAS